MIDVVVTHKSAFFDGIFRTALSPFMPFLVSRDTSRGKDTSRGLLLSTILAYASPFMLLSLRCVFQNILCSLPFITNACYH